MASRPDSTLMALALAQTAAWQRPAGQTIYTHVEVLEPQDTHARTTAADRQSQRKAGEAAMDAYVMQRLVSNRQADVTRDHQTARGLRVWVFLDRFGR